jgi:glutathione synthase/RimK-type ligase-like ATP-grasp enzyme
MIVKLSGNIFSFDEKSLKAIYYRAPIYLRDIYKANLPKEEQLFRSQWTAFIRNLSIFRNATWVNNPESTFKAENKMLQLRVAKDLGMLCPNTFVTNNNHIAVNPDKDYIVKSLDAAVLWIDDKEAFVYSNRVKGREIERSSLSLAPVILQDYLSPKIDVRVTAIGRTLYPVRILKNGKGVEGDWRTFKSDIDFVPFSLPSEIAHSCINLLKQLGLSFGGIDLIESEGKFYFIEINPTGEWGWLIGAANLPIQEAICSYLERKDV